MKKRLNVLVAFLMLVILLGSTNVAFAVGEDLGTWTTKADMPTGRHGLGTATVNGKIYAIGGYFVGSDTVEEYNPATDTWTTKANMPTARSYFGVAEVNGKIYAIGGDNNGSISTVEEYDPATDIWTTKASMPTARQSLAVVTVNEKIYAIGGYDGLTTVEEYNPESDTWASKSSMPTARQNLATVAVNGKIYAIGGGTGSTRLATVEEYDPVTDTWTTKSSMPTERINLGAAVVNGKIYAIGGLNVTGSLDNVEEYDPTTDTWTTKASIPTPRYYFGCSEADNQIYVIGGYNKLNKVEVFTPLIQAPDAPINLIATAGDSKVTLSWDAVTDATSYTVKRATAIGGPYTTIASAVTDTSYIDTDVTNGTTYYYVVTATVDVTESDNSNEASATPQADTPVQTGSAIITITMVNGTEKEYDLTMTEVNDFIDWYKDKDNGTGNAYYTIEKDWNTGPFDSRKDYIIFDKICFFEINQY